MPLRIKYAEGIIINKTLTEGLRLILSSIKPIIQIKKLIEIINSML